MPASSQVIGLFTLQYVRPAGNSAGPAASSVDLHGITFSGYGFTTQTRQDRRAGNESKAVTAASSPAVTYADRRDSSDGEAPRSGVKSP